MIFGAVLLGVAIYTLVGLASSLLLDRLAKSGLACCKISVKINIRKLTD